MMADHPGGFPGRGSPRVQGWIYGAINPLADAFETEQKLLSAHKITWRFASQDLEYIWEPRRYLDPGGRTVLADLLRALSTPGFPVSGHDSLKGRLEVHGARIVRIRSAAETYHRALVEEPTFVSLVKAALDRYHAEQ